MAASNEVLLRQAKSNLAKAKGPHKAKWAAEVARLEALLNPPPTPEVVPEPTPVAAVVQPPTTATTKPKPLPPSVRVKGKGGRLATGSSHRDIKVTFGGKVPDKALDAIDAAFAGLRQRRTARA